MLGMASFLLLAGSGPDSVTGRARLDATSVGAAPIAVSSMVAPPQPTAFGYEAVHTAATKDGPAEPRL